MKNSLKPRLFLLPIVILLLMLISGTILFWNDFHSRSSKYINESVQNLVHGMIDMAANPYSDKILRVIKDITLIDKQISQTNESRSISSDDIGSYVKTLIESEGASEVAFLDKKCRYTTTEGESGLLDVALDLVDLYGGSKEPMVRNLKWRRGQNRFIVAVPVDDFFVGGEKYSAIFAAFPPEVINAIFDVGSFSLNSNIFLLDNTGLVLFSNVIGTDNSDNILSLYRAQGIIDEKQLLDIKKDFKAGGSGHIAIDKGGVETFFCYGSTNAKQNLVLEIPANVARSSLTDYGNMITRTVVTLGSILILMLLLISGLYFVRSRERAVAREEKRSRDMLERSNRKLRAARMAADEANMAKSMFLSNMSHDIRTPMNAIVGFTGLAINHIEDRDLLIDYLQKIRQSSNHLLCLINDVLDMSHIESGKMTINVKPENLYDILAGVKSLADVEADKKAHRFTVDIDGIKDSHVLCDSLHLSQVLINLLSNAIKYTPEGGEISLTVNQIMTEDSETATYVFRVKDNGIGMDEEFVKTIFDPFSREKNTTLSGIQGTGLGMSITKNILDMMDGTIDIKSEKGKGTEVTFTVGLEIIDSQDEIAEKAPAEYNFSGKKLLLVEDNELNREIASMILSEEGFVIDVAEDGTVAVEKIANAGPGDYDVILMDIQMPVLNGYDATRQIRSLGAPLSDIPIIAMTANAFEEDRRLAFEAGMNEHVAKPIDIPKLKEALSKVLN